MALAYSIASQQLSSKAADTIFSRFCDLFPPDRVPDPARLATIDADAIRAVGFSRPKAGFLKDLAAQVVDRRLPLDSLHELDDDEVMRMLTAVKGIGRWTAEVFLMFRLGRPDIFPADDLGLVKAVAAGLPLPQAPVARAAADDRRTLAALPLGGRLVSVAESRDGEDEDPKDELRRTKKTKDTKKARRYENFRPRIFVLT